MLFPWQHCQWRVQNKAWKSQKLYAEFRNPCKIVLSKDTVMRSDCAKVLATKEINQPHSHRDVVRAMHLNIALPHHILLLYLVVSGRPGAVQGANLCGTCAGARTIDQILRLLNTSGRFSRLRWPIASPVFLPKSCFFLCYADIFVRSAMRIDLVKKGISKTSYRDVDWSDNLVCMDTTIKHGGRANCCLKYHDRRLGGHWYWWYK